jgi:predicted porin
MAASDIGNEPYQNFRLGIRKYGNYRFSYERQKSAYFYSDLLIDPADEDPNASNGGDFHHFDYDRVRDQLKLDVNLNDHAKFLLDLNQYTKNGDSTTVFGIDRDEFELEQPIDQKLVNYNIGFEYDWEKSVMTFNQRWRDFDNQAEVYLLNPSEGSHPFDPTRLDNYFLEQPFGYNSRETQVNFTMRPSDSWQLQANALYADLDLDLASTELALGSDYLGQLLQFNITGEGQSMRTIRQLFLSAGYAFNDRIRLTASLREQDSDQNSAIQLDDDYSENQWHIDSTTFAVGLETLINNNWTLTGGLTTEDRKSSHDPDSLNSELHENENTQNDGYYLILGYRPKKGLSLTVSTEKNVIDDPYTLSSPTDSQNIRLNAAYKWDNGFKLSSAYVWRKSENDVSGWEASSKQTNLKLTYAKDPITLSFGTTFVDLERNIDQLVTAGFIQVLLPIYYQADADFWDGSIGWKISPRSHLMGSYRYYDNNGSFVVKRNDARLGFNFDLQNSYSIGANYRNIEYQEDYEDFDAEILEITFGGRW